MTVQTKTYTVALDSSENPETLPLIGAAVGFTTTRWVVINNLTPYIMLLDGVGDNTTNQASVSPGTANKYPWTQKNGPLIAQWVNPIAGTAPPATPQVVVEYSDDPTGSDLQGTYPATLNGSIQIGTISGTVTLTGPVTIDDVEGVVTFQGVTDELAVTGPPWTATALNVYQAIVITAIGWTSPPNSFAVQDSTGAFGSMEWSAGVGTPQGANGAVKAVVPIANNAGDTISISPVGGTQGPGTIVAFGLSNGPVPPIRSDGRAYPIGRFTAQGTTLAGGTLQAAILGQSVLLKNASFLVQSSGAPGGFIALAGIINGNSVFLGVGAATTSQLGAGQMVVPDTGILLDANTALTYVTGGANTAIVVDAIYDLVPQ